jgi:hypothetical protein
VGNAVLPSTKKVIMSTKHKPGPFSVMGFTVESAEQARSILVVAKLQGRRQVVEQCLSLIRQYEAQV